MNELRLTSKYSAEDLRRIGRYGEVGEPNIDRMAFEDFSKMVRKSDAIKKHGLVPADDAFARLGYNDTKFVDVAESAMTKARREFLDLEASVKRDLGWSETAVTDLERNLEGELRERVYGAFGMVRPAALDAPVAMFGDGAHVVVYVERKSVRLIGRVDPSSAEGKSLLLRVAKISREGTTDLFVDNAAVPLLKKYGVPTEGWRVYTGQKGTYRLRDNVYASSSELQHRASKLFASRLPAKRRVLSFEADPALDAEVRKIVPSKTLIAVGAKTPTLPQILDANRNSLIAVLAHIENGVLHGRWTISVAEFRELARARGITPVILGCNSAACGAGVAGQLQLTPLGRRAVEALSKPTVGEMWQAIATERNPVFVDTMFERELTATLALEPPHAPAAAQLKIPTVSDESMWARMTIERNKLVELEINDWLAPMLVFVPASAPSVDVQPAQAVAPALSTTEAAPVPTALDAAPVARAAPDSRGDGRNYIATLLLGATLVAAGGVGVGLIRRRRDR